MFGRESQLGTLELLTPERRLEALRLVREGVTVNLDHPLNLPLSIFKHRRPFRHNIFEILPGYLDETLDDFAPQLSSHLDSFRHVSSPDGFYNGLVPAGSELEAGGNLGIDKVAIHGIVGRGVLLDLPRYFASLGESIEPNTRREIATSVLDDAARFQRVEIREADILLIRFGVDEFLRELTADPDAHVMRYEAPGLQQDETTVRWLWDRHLAAVCADNIAVEVTPPRGPATRIHPAILGLLGMPMGELFDMTDLAAACSERDRFEFAFVAKPIRLPGGVGSPANAMAIF